MKKNLFCILTILVWIGFYAVSSVGWTMVPAKKISILPGTSNISLREKLPIPVAEWRFKFYLKYFVSNFSLQSGTYVIPENTVVRDLFTTVLKKPQNTDIEITILPGWNLYDIDVAWAKMGIIKTWELSDISWTTYGNLKKKFPFLSGMLTLEGTLLPDTYRVRPDATIEDILSKILTEFNVKIYQKIPEPKKKRFIETLIMASIVEREERSKDQKPIVAGILIKRLKEGIAIWADATVCYPFKLTNKECTPSFIAEHISEPSEYNTRKKPGLPRTPICNPSLSTWTATINPEASEYYYYLHDSKGIIHYGRTLEEHNRNKMLYLGS